MCMLALTVYIDHEPFNILNVPAMCRTYEYRFSTASNTKHRTWLMDGTTVVDQGELINVELLGGLVKHLIEYLKAQVIFTGMPCIESSIGRNPREKLHPAI